MRTFGEPRQVRLERAVDLDGVDERDALGEVAGEDAEARADLEHDVAGLELGEPADHAEDVLVDEEVLAELLLAGGRSQQPEGGGGVRLDLRLELGRVLAARRRERRRACASTFAGSFGRPRTGCGAR